MLKIFRNIRKQLLGEGKKVRYFKYAIGEIVLVVIGILIALSINNWNQENTNRTEELNYYKNIKRQLNEDKYAIEGTVHFNSSFLEQFRYAIMIIEKNDRSEIDSLAQITINLQEFSDFHRQSNIYQAMVNSGEIKLLKNQKIIEGLQHLEEIYIYINKLEDTHSKASMSFAVPVIVNSIKVFDMSIKNQENLYTFEFQNMLVLITKLMRQKNKIYQRGLDEINVLNNLIDDELGIQKNKEE
jgi:hypothetical protein